ncbi:MAG: DUF4263 domain-containing protein [Lacibacter sp.]|jgi:hypothetical protein
MPKPKAKKTAVKPIEVVIKKPGYGKALIGIVVYFEGFENLITDENGQIRPKMVDKLGAFPMGKNILESLTRTFKKFQLKISKIKSSSVKKVGDKYIVCLSDTDYTRMKSGVIDEIADVKNDIIRKRFSIIYPKYYKTSGSTLYRAGTLERIIPENGAVSLSLGDKARIRKLYSSAILSGLSKSSVTSTDIARERAVFELSTLEAYADALEKKIVTTKDEAEWQIYIREHILNLKEEYIAKEEKINTSIGRTSFPDFLLISQDNFLDVLEIKTPFTPLVQFDKSHNNYYLSSELMKAIAQAEKYIDQVSAAGLELEKYISKRLKLPFGVVRPGGLIIVGSEKSLDELDDPAQAKEDFRRLRNSFKNIKIITYTELLIGLRNRITILKQLKDTAVKNKNLPKRVTKKKVAKKKIRR